MDGTLSWVYSFTFLPLFLVNSVIGLNQTYCTGEQITGNRPLCADNGHGNKIRVRDVLVYDFSWNEYRPCSYSSLDRGERLVDVSPDDFATIVKACDGRRVCQDFEVADVQLSDGHTSNYVIMHYRCTQNTEGERYFVTNIWLHCPFNHKIEVERVYFYFNCGGRSFLHVDRSYQAYVQRACNYTSYCYDVQYQTRTADRDCRRNPWISYVVVYIKCSTVATTITIQPTTIEIAPQTTTKSINLPPVPDITTTSHPSTTVTWDTASHSGTTEKDWHNSGKTGTTQQTSPNVSHVTQANMRDQTSGTLQIIGLYAGVAVAGVVLIVAIIVIVVCVKRRRANNKNTSSLAHVNPDHNGHPSDQVSSTPRVATDNVYTMEDDDYSQVGPAVDQVSPAPRIATDNVYTMGEEGYSQVGSAVNPAGHHTEHNTNTEARVQVGARSVHYTTNSGHSGTNAIHGEGATPEDDYSLATAVDEYAVVNRQTKDPDELEIVDNVNYEQCPIKFTSGTGTAARVDHDDIDQTVMVENTDYVPWGEKSTAGGYILRSIVRAEP